MQGHVHDRLVERARQERRVDADHRTHAGHREARCKRDSVLLADSHVEETVGKFFGEIEQPGRGRHGSGDRADVGVRGRGREQGFAEHVRVRELGAQRSPGERIEGADTVELVDLVLDRGPVAMPLLGHHVDHDRLAQA